MKTRPKKETYASGGHFRVTWAIDLSKKPYMVAYPCCQVMDCCLETTRCWSCGEHGGYSLIDIPKWNPEYYESMYLVADPAKKVSMRFSETPEGDIGWRP